MLSLDLDGFPPGVQFGLQKEPVDLFLASFRLMAREHRLLTFLKEACFVGGHISLVYRLGIVENLRSSA
jgi:hypothetical protein